MNRIYWVRHGENRANLTLEFSHRRVDYSLTQKGVLQAQQTAEALRDKGIHQVYSSPLKRAVETARIIAAPLSLPVTILEGLREVNVGELENRPPSAESWALHSQILENWLDGKPDESFPGGENYPMLMGRVRAAFEQIAAGGDDRNIVVVGHGGTIFLVLPKLCPGLDSSVARTAAIGNCSITEFLLGWHEGQLECRLVSWASCAHLSGTAAELVPGVPDADHWHNSAA